MSSRFYLWLKGQTERDDPIGDFALDAVDRHGGFPHTENFRPRIWRFLRYATRHDRRFRKDVLAAFDEAWEEFEQFDAARRRSLPVKLRFSILKRDRFRCRLCGRKPPEVKLEVDHVIAVANGGRSEEQNLMTLCFDCNRGKGASDL